MAVVMMPALSPTMTEGKLARWLVKEGDEVRAGDVIAEIETDKALMEIEAVDDGKVAKLAVAEGSEGVAVGTPIAEILAEGEEASKADKPAPQVSETHPKEVSEKPTPPAPKKEQPTPQEKSERIVASPLAKRIAKEKGVDLAKIKGSGPKGRIVKADIIATSPSMQASSTGERSSLVENSSMRMMIAERLQQSMQNAPHFYINADIEIDALLAARKSLNAAAPEGVKVSVNDMIVKIVALTLMQHPQVNASWEDKHTRLHAHADVAIAVAIEGGLITPILMEAETKGLYEIATQTGELINKAKEGKLQPEEYVGGSFTISNLGMFGVKSFTAVINPPHSAILAIGAGEERPIVREGNIEIATIMTVTLSCDHRVVDGAEGARWLATFKRFMENPVLALG